VKARIPLFLVLLALALAAPASAAAAPAFNLDPTGHNPRVVVSGGGNGFFTWTTPAGANNVFHYCRIPQGGSECNAALAYAPGNGDVDGGYALFAPGRVLLVDARCCGAFYALKEVFTSINGGTTFSGPVSPGQMNGTGDNIAGHAIYAPAGAVGRGAESVLTISNGETLGITLQATGTGTGSETGTANLGDAADASYQGSIALQGTGALVATMATLDKLYWRMWDGSGDVNDVTNWTPPVLLDATNVDSNAKLVAGKSGMYVTYNTGALSHRAFYLRRFTGAGWGPKVKLSETNSPDFGDLVEDSTGRLHFAWQDSRGRLRYRYARSAANTQFSQAQVLGPANENHAFLKLGVNSAGRGWITWDDIPGVRAVPIAPGEPPYNGPTKKTSKDLGPGSVFMKTPKNCVGPGQLFRVKAGKEGKVTIDEVVVSVDGDKVGSDSKGPFKVSVPTNGLAKGAHTVKAKVTAHFKKNGHKKTKTKTLSTGFAIC
jgi:Bacterial Ig domain